MDSPLFGEAGTTVAARALGKATDRLVPFPCLHNLSACASSLFLPDLSGVSADGWSCARGKQSHRSRGRQQRR